MSAPVHKSNADAFTPWAMKNLSQLRSEYQAELDAGEWIDWERWLLDRWFHEELRREAA